MDDPLLYHKLIEKRNGDDGQSKLVALVDIPKNSIVCCSYPMAIVPVFSLLPRFHKSECQIITAIAANEEKRTDPSGSPVEVSYDIIILEIMMVRMMLGLSSKRIVQDFSAVPVRMNDHPYYRPVTAKDMDLLLRKYDACLEQRQQAECLYNYMSSTLGGSMKTPSSVLKQLYFAYKRFSVFVLREGSPIAEAIFPPLCELEASETPNLSCYFCNQLLVLTAARDIKQGESVTFSFIPHSLPVLYKTQLYMNRCMPPPIVSASTFSPDLMGLKCIHGHPVPLSYDLIETQLCPVCGEKVFVDFLLETDRGVVFVPSLKDFDHYLSNGYSYKEAIHLMEGQYDSDNYILYRCYLRCRDYYLQNLDYVNAIPFCYQIVNYIKAYQPDQIQQLQNESIILADTLMRCCSIQDAIAILNDVIDLMEKHSCFSAEDIDKVMELKRKWDMSLIMQSYLKTY
ncbi:hypothetical protein AV274_0578 [Blastocystis sp. ATCC 50177/Nand II]|uniref:SET domain-containing protein n=1 Tax=Blastocystis sp. subtype 1 (strain ATCC 50177 / NandII) TaxID=478820 RepID=A0A196SNC9_BLAHN|nr:hypothetical protein AV274_0578 [Blastocystis sp. ATCC 50177/Nand II]